MYAFSEQLHFDELLLNLEGNSGQLWGSWWICLALDRRDWQTPL